MMSSTEDEPPTVNGRLRPRRSSVPGTPRARSSRKSDPKQVDEKPKKSGSPSKKSNDSSKPHPHAKKTPEKTDDDNLITSSHLKVLCPYCDKKFASKKSVSKHVGRVHPIPSKQEFFQCQYCKETELDGINIIKHMVDNHPNQYFACLDCHTRFHSTSELAIHKLNVCEKPKHLSAKPYRNKLRQKIKHAQKRKKSVDSNEEFRLTDRSFPNAPGFNGIVISCELKPSQAQDPTDIEDNITTNLILPPNKNIVNGEVLENNAVIVLDDIQWNKRIPSNFSFHNSDTDQILSRLGVVHRSPRTSEHTRRDWYKQIEDSTKFERCFDTTFYSKVAGNVQENLTKFLEGSFNRFHIDPENIIKTRKPKSNINTAEGFPILLASEQFSRNLFESYMPRAIAPRHKWKWETVESDRGILNPDQIKRDSHVNNCIITLVSSLDIWTQLRMRLKFEAKFNKTSYIEKKSEKQSIISKELKEILESREIPKPSAQVMKSNTPKYTPYKNALDFPSSLGLMPATPKYEVSPAVLSGEWTRPRCYVCCACGERANDSRALNVHIGTQHPMAQVAHYEVVGECLLNADILKHLYVPPSQPVNKTRPIRGIRNECTKCRNPIGQDELHQHMLECAGDTPVIRRKVRSRPFGVRRRRPRAPDNTIRKKIRTRMRARQTRQKVHLRPRPRIRTEVGDAETIRKMLADLPAKRHRVVINPNPNIRPLRRREQTRNKIMMKRLSDDPSKTRILRGGRHIPTTSSTEALPSDTGNPNKDNKNNVSKPKTRVANKVMRQTEALRRKTLMRQAKRKAHAMIKQTASNESAEEKRTGTVSLSLDNSSPERINVNKDTGKARGHAARDSNSNNNDGRTPAGNEQERNQNSAAPANNAPLKHSIARLTANTETHDKSVQFQPHFLVQQECYKNIDRFRPVGQPTLFENETASPKLDKPPLADSNPRFDPYILQKNKQDKQKRKGLNACIAMLKNKQKTIEPEGEEILASGHRSVQCDTADMPQYDEPPLPPVPSPEEIHTHSESIYPGRESTIPLVAPAPAPPHSPAPAHAADYLPLDLSGKPPPHKLPGYENQTLDLSNKNREVDVVAIDPESIIFQEEDVEENNAVDLCMNTHDTECTLDLSKRPRKKNEEITLNYSSALVHETDVSICPSYAAVGSSQDYVMHDIEQLNILQRPPLSGDGLSHEYANIHTQQVEFRTRNRYEHEVSPPEYAVGSVPHMELLKRNIYPDHMLSQDINSAQQIDLSQRQRPIEHDIVQEYTYPKGHQTELSQRAMNRHDILPQHYTMVQMQQPIQQIDTTQGYKDDINAYAQDYTIPIQPMHFVSSYVTKEQDFTVPLQPHHETNKLRKHRHKERISLPPQDFAVPSTEQSTIDISKTQLSDVASSHFQPFVAQVLTSQQDMIPRKPRSKEALQKRMSDALNKPTHEVLPQEYNDISQKKRYNNAPPVDQVTQPIQLETLKKPNNVEDKDSSMKPVQKVNSTPKSKKSHSLSAKDYPGQHELVQKVKPVNITENVPSIKLISLAENEQPMKPEVAIIAPVKPIHTIKNLEQNIKEAIIPITQVSVGQVAQTKSTALIESTPEGKPIQVIKAVISKIKPVQVIEPVIQTKQQKPVPQSKPVLTKKSLEPIIKDARVSGPIEKIKPSPKKQTAKKKKVNKQKKKNVNILSSEPNLNAIEQIDLSKEDSDEDVKIPVTQMIETDLKKELGGNYTSEIIDAKDFDKSQEKTVFDPALKIPQYKLGVTEANSTSSDTPSVAGASSDLATPSPIASLANAIREYAIAMNIITACSSGPTYTTQSTSPPLYTEAGTSSNKPTTSVASTGSLGALIATTSKTATSIGAELNPERSQIVVPISSVQDLEIAKKIAMLPKEIVEILSRMPTDHRNQILNILPQYMVYDTSAQQLQLVVDISSDLHSKSKMNKSEIATQTSCSVEPVCPPEFLNVDTEKFLIDPVTGALTERKEKESDSELILTPEGVVQDKLVEIIQKEPNNLKKDAIEDNESKNKNESDKLSLNVIENCKEPSFVTLMSPNLALPNCKETKEVNEKMTASLRAVRIKPSERRKSQLLAAKNAETLKPVASISDSVSLDHDIDKYEPLAIQQDEVSSTRKFSNKNVKVYSVVPLVAKENETIVTTNNKEKGISTEEDRNTNNQVMLQSIKTILPNLTVDTELQLLDCNKQSQRLSESKEKITLSESNGEQHNPRSFVDVKQTKSTTDSILLSTPNKEPMAMDVLPQDFSALKSIDVSLIENSKKMYNEDDSEDDISLAVIFKKKKLFGNKSMAMVIRDERKNDEFHVKKSKCKKTNKNRKPDNNMENYVKSNPSLKSDTKVDKIIFESNSNTSCNENSIKPDVPSEKVASKRRRGRRSIRKTNNELCIQEISTVNIISTENKYDTAIASVKTPSISMDSVSTDKILKSKGNEIEAEVVTAEISSEANEPLISQKSAIFPEHPKGDISITLTKPCKKIEVLNLQKDIIKTTSTEYHKESKLSKKRKILSKNRKNMIANYEMVDFQVIQSDNEVAPSKPVKGDSTPYVTVNEKTEIENLLLADAKPGEHDIKITNVSDMTTVAGCNNILNDSKKCHESKNFRKCKSKDSSHLQTTDDLYVLKWVDDMQPLRRSRRGKSMYIESATENHELSETIVENKAPLPKKQLIFSKLLLDEENSKTTSGVVENTLKKDLSDFEVLNTQRRENNDTIHDETNVETQEKNNIISLVESDCKKPVLIGDNSKSDEQSGIIAESHKTTAEVYFTTEKRKPIKRKKPPQSKLNNKRKKSIDFVLSRDSSAETKKNQVQKNETHRDTSLETSICESDTKLVDINKSRKQSINNTHKETIEPGRIKQVKKEETTIASSVQSQQSSKIIRKIELDSNNVNTLKEINVEMKLLELQDSEVFPKKGKGRKKVKRGLQKRRMSTQGNTPVSRSSSPKKLRESELETSYTEITDIDINVSHKLEANPLFTKENVKTTPCYDMPKVAARTHSQSVLIKSLQQMDYDYDPYDIDLEEKLLQNIKSIPKKTLTTLESDSPISTKSTPQQKLKKLRKSRTVSTVNIIDIESSCNPVESDHLNNGTENNSDTDDSEMSDIPLKNIQRNKKTKPRKVDEDVVIENIEIKTRGRKRKNCKQNKLHEDDVVKENTEKKTEDDADERRSEQFMESFGFFSKRKPRKSNLLASKKISETFHIIASENEDVDYDIKNSEQSTKQRNEDREQEREPERDQEREPEMEQKREPKRDQEREPEMEQEREPEIEQEREPEREQERTRSPSLSASDSESNQSISRQIPHCIARRKKGNPRVIDPETYCETCDKEFRRADNLVRHYLSLFHISRLLKKEMGVDIEPIKEEPNFLLIYKQHLERLKRITERIEKESKKLGIDAPPKIRMPTFAEIMSDVRVQAFSLAHHTRRGLSHDEALFLHCCQMLKESHTTAEIDLPPDLEPVHRMISETQSDSKSDGDVDSITAKNILESEEVRNLENDFITGLKETLNVADDASVTTLKASDECLASTSRGESSKLLAHNLQHTSMGYTHQIPVTEHMMTVTVNEPTLSANVNTVTPKNPETIETTTVVTVHKEPKSAKLQQAPSDSCSETLSHTKPKSSSKDQNPSENTDNLEEPAKKINRITEILEFDMFEDKFDKIKRKCRSQTAAQTAAAAAATTKSSQPTAAVTTKSHKTRKKAEKKKTKKKSKKSQSIILTKGAMKGFDGIKVSIPTSDINMSAIIRDSPPKKKKKNSGKKRRSKRDTKSSVKNETEERPSSSVSSISKQKDVYEFEDNEDEVELRPSTKDRFKTSTKESPPPVERQAAGDAVSDDDFVYMSDDYNCCPSADETEASVDVDSGKLAADPKRSSSFKRKDVVEKNAVMGKIFKNNAVKKFSAKEREPAKSTTTNLDQLFDSLLEKEPDSSTLKDGNDPMPASSTVEERRSPSKNMDLDTSDSPLNESPEMIRKSPDTISTLTSEVSRPRSPGDVDVPPPSVEDYSALDPGAERRHRARRKCTVGKQNVLAETWSSESELELGSAGGGEERRRRGPRKGSQHRRPKHVTFKKQEESRVREASPPGCSSDESSQDAAGSAGAAPDWGAPAPQHGWIVGSSHKKLVTMLAHAKGRKHDDSPYVE